VVYRVTLLPVVRDLFNNQLRDPFELVFTTGQEFSPTAVAGLVWDRITGEGVEPAEVRALSDGPDSLMHVAMADTGGVYAFRFLPPGRYRVVAFQDRNRDGNVDPMEVQGERGILLNAATDTMLLPLAVLQPDTTPARITSVEILDSLTVTVEFDDHLDPSRGFESVGAALASDSGSAPGVVRLLHADEYMEYVGAVTDSFARLDSLEAVERAAAQAAALPAAATDTAALPDSAPAPDSSEVAAVVPAEDTRPQRRPPPALEGARRGDPPFRPDGSDAPARAIVLILAEHLVPNRAYQLTVTGIENINGVGRGGGEAAVVLTPPPPDTTAADSLSVTDTLAVADTLVTPPDTGVVRFLPRYFFRPSPRE
jgi:hypothetical protein